MKQTEKLELRHSVAFRVTEKEWRHLKSLAAKEGLTISRLAKQCLFEAAKVRRETKERRSYGQARK
jgi:hypothetical protein